MGLRVIVTGASGLVGEGVMLECLKNAVVDRVLVVGRRPCGTTHVKLEELLVPDFRKLDAVEAQLAGYDACFYCAGISSRGMSEADYTVITLDTPLAFAQVLLKLNPKMILGHISGSHTDGTEKGRVMWARVKGRAENALMKLPFPRVYNFRPGLMRPSEGQKNVQRAYRVLGGTLFPVFHALFPNNACTMHEVGLAMIHSVLRGYAKQVLEVPDIKALAVSA